MSFRKENMRIACDLLFSRKREAVDTDLIKILFMDTLYVAEIAGLVCRKCMTHMQEMLDSSGGPET
jgi:hypothetical protein